jgi:hypothetical protein
MNSYDRQQNHRIPSECHEFRADEPTAERVTNSARSSTPRSASRFQCVMISARSAEENTEERATISFVIILLSRFVRPFSSALNAQRGGAYRGARHEFRTEELTAKRVANSARRSKPRSVSQFQRATICARSAEENTAERVTISAQRSKPRSMSRL